MTLLSGVRVVEMTTLLPGPYAGRLLADRGAEVTKVEPPAGDPTADWLPDIYEALQADKEVVGLDLKTDEGRKELHALIAGADLFVTTNRPATLAKLGADEGTLRDVEPDLVVAQLAGHDDPDRIGHDVTYAAEAGLLDEPPRLMAVPVADLAGAERLVAEATAALLHRERTGEAVKVQVSCTEVARQWARAGRPIGEMLQVVAGYGVYRCADGAWIALGALEQEYFERLLEALERPEWTARDRLALGEEVADRIAEEDRATWEERFADHGVPAAPVAPGPS